jgi:hypothetical protein
MLAEMLESRLSDPGAEILEVSRVSTADNAHLEVTVPMTGACRREPPITIRVGADVAY